MSATAKSMISCTARTLSPGTVRRDTAPMYGPLSSASAKNSAMSTPTSIASTTTPASDIAGPRTGEARGRLRWARSLAAKTALLAVIFLLVPAFLYLEFRADYEQSQDLLLRSVRDEGRVISQSLLPMLQNADTGSLPQLGQYLARFAGQVTTIELLLAPAAAGGAANGFYYVASWPTVAPSNLQAQREMLARQGVLDRLV